MKNLANFLRRKALWLCVIAIAAVIITIPGCETEAKSSCAGNHNCFYRLTPDSEGRTMYSCGDVDCDAAKASRESAYGNPRSGYCSCH